MKKTKMVALAVLMLSLFVAQPAISAEIRIAQQFGLGYAPLILIEKYDLLEEILPDITVKWTQLGSGAAINEALVAGKVDVGCMGVGPFLIGWDKGAPWKMASALVCQPLGLQVNDPSIQSLKDIKPEHKIALPAPGSIQHILLAMAAEKEIGDAKALDNNLVAMAHPDGANALIAGAGGVTGHFTSPPYIFEELKAENVHQVVDAKDAFGGDFTFLVSVATKNFHDKNPMFYAAFVQALNKAIHMINYEPEKVAKTLASEFNIEESTMLEYLTWPSTNFTSTPYGILGFAEFMKEAGYLSKTPDSYEDIAWENITAIVGLQHGEAKSVIERAQIR
jgi:NitT/TauT family transport system substrate-binding protein